MKAECGSGLFSKSRQKDYVIDMPFFFKRSLCICLINVRRPFRLLSQMQLLHRRLETTSQFLGGGCCLPILWLAFLSKLWAHRSLRLSENPAEALNDDATRRWGPDRTGLLDRTHKETLRRNDCFYDQSPLRPFSRTQSAENEGGGRSHLRFAVAAPRSRTGNLPIVSSPSLTSLS